MALIQRLLFILVPLAGQAQNRVVPRAGPWAKCQAHGHGDGPCQAWARVMRAWAVLSSAVPGPA
jgi:hypothetical protein